MKRLEGQAFYRWTDISKEFKGSDLLLGNGFSISIHSSLEYRSLFKEFLKSCTVPNRSIFQKFKKSNFEAIQRNLQAAIDTNKIFAYPTRRIKSAKAKLRTGLIKTVTKLHPRYRLIDEEKIEDISKKLDHFGDVFTLNYDTFLYHIILKTWDRKRESPKTKIKCYQDFFRLRNGDLVFKRISKSTTSKNVYYLHGALFLHYDEERDEIVKLRSQDDFVELIDRVRASIHDDQIPLFVSEGGHKMKSEHIKSNRYLSFCWRRFEEAQNDLVIFGFSFSHLDQHCIDVLKQSAPDRRIAISIHSTDRAEIIRQMKTINAKLSGLKRSQIRYFSTDGFI